MNALPVVMTLLMAVVPDAGVRVSGRVLGEGAGLAALADYDVSLTAGEQVVATAKTDWNGAFAFSNVAPGEYHLLSPA